MDFAYKSGIKKVDFTLSPRKEASLAALFPTYTEASVFLSLGSILRTLDIVYAITFFYVVKTVLNEIPLFDLELALSISFELIRKFLA